MRKPTQKELSGELAPVVLTNTDDLDPALPGTVDMENCVLIITR